MRTCDDKTADSRHARRRRVPGCLSDTEASLTAGRSRHRSPAAASELKPIVMFPSSTFNRAAMDCRAHPAAPGGFKTDTFRTTTGTSACIDAASSAWNACPERRGTLRAFTSNALGQPSRRLTKNFDKVRVRCTSKGAFSVQDASGDTMRTSIIISIAAASGMSSGAATITSGADSGSRRTCRQASAPNQSSRKPVRARPHHATSRFTGMSARVSRTMDCKPQRTP